ncbi:hypothetical protein [Microvirga zambiensis]|uniref:hypothetical protein n=1 Tax=Microvirga zambiensis TaxID=1402137 RepID=UPI00191E21AA|nr:hypothetical protein [Microvirga zambiensis]
MSDFSGVFAEALPLRGMRDLPAEPFACDCDAMEFSNQLWLTHLVQANHGATTFTSTEGTAVSAVGRLPVICRGGRLGRI